MKTLSREEFEAQAAIPVTPEELERIRQRKEARRNMTDDEIQDGLKQMLDQGIGMKTLSREEFEAQTAIPPTPEEFELIRKKKEIRRKIFAEAIAKQEMISQVKGNRYQPRATPWVIKTPNTSRPRKGQGKPSGALPLQGVFE